jgi:hypothetical protein
MDSLGNLRSTLEQLTESRDSIVKGRDVFLTCAIHFDVAPCLENVISRCSSFSTGLGVLYVLNDSFFSPRCPHDLASRLFHTCLLICKKVSTLAGANQERKHKVLRVTQIWMQKRVFTREECEQLIGACVEKKVSSARAMEDLSVGEAVQVTQENKCRGVKAFAPLRLLEGYVYCPDLSPRSRAQVESQVAAFYRDEKQSRERKRRPG